MRDRTMLMLNLDKETPEDYEDENERPYNVNA